MTHEAFLAAKPLENDIDVLTQALTLFTDTPPDIVTPDGIGTLISQMMPIINTFSGDARVTTALNDVSLTYWTALRDQLIAVRIAITADRDAI